jgi:hypothetical protein
MLLDRYWSLLAAFLISALTLYGHSIDIEPVFFQNPANVVSIVCLIYMSVTALCVGLAVQSWRVQRSFTRNKWRLAFWTHVLLLPALVTIVLALGRIQVSTYDLAEEREQFQRLHWYAGDLKDFLVWLVPLDIVLILPWAIVASFKNKVSNPHSAK